MLTGRSLHLNSQDNLSWALSLTSPVTRMGDSSSFYNMYLKQVKTETKYKYLCFSHSKPFRGFRLLSLWQHLVCRFKLLHHEFHELSHLEHCSILARQRKVTDFTGRCWCCWDSRWRTPLPDSLHTVRGHPIRAEWCFLPSSFLGLWQVVSAWMPLTSSKVSSIGMQSSSTSEHPSSSEFTLSKR